MSKDEHCIFALSMGTNACCLKVDHRGFQISMSLDNSCGEHLTMWRGTTRIYDHRAPLQATDPSSKTDRTIEFYGNNEGDNTTLEAFQRAIARIDAYYARGESYEPEIKTDTVVVEAIRRCEESHANEVREIRHLYSFITKEGYGFSLMISDGEEANAGLVEQCEVFYHCYERRFIRNGARAMPKHEDLLKLPTMGQKEYDLRCVIGDWKRQALSGWRGYR